MLKQCMAPAVAGLLMLSPAVMAQEPAGQPQTQQPAAEGQQQPRAEEPRAEQPRAEQPRAEQPRAEQPRAEQPRAEQPRAEQQRTDQQEHAGVIRADRIIGQSVRGTGDDRLGRIDDLALNVNENKVKYAVVSRGGLFGIGAETVAVSWEQIRPDTADRVVRYDGTAEQLERARSIDTRTAWPADHGRPVEGATDRPAGERAAGETDRPAGQTDRPAAEADRPVGTAGTGEARMDAAHGTLSISRLIGMDVENQQGERLGQIDDIALDRDGSVRYAVIAHGGFLGMGHNYVAVPWDRIQMDSQKEHLRLNVTQQQLESARAFEHRNDRWPDRVDWPFGN